MGGDIKINILSYQHDIYSNSKGVGLYGEAAIKKQSSPFILSVGKQFVNSPYT